MKKYLLALALIILLTAGAVIGVQHMTWTTGTPVPLPAVWFVSGDESYGALMRNGNHWEWELTLSLSEIILIDGIIGFLIWPAIRRHIHRDVDAAEEHEHEQQDLLHNEIAELRQHILVLEGDEEAIMTEVREGRKSINWARVKLGMVPLG